MSSSKNLAASNNFLKDERYSVKKHKKSYLKDYLSISDCALGNIKAVRNLKCCRNRGHFVVAISTESEKVTLHNN